MESALNNSTKQAPSRASRVLEAFMVLLIVLTLIGFSPRLSALLFLVIYLLVAAFSRSARRFGVATTTVAGFFVLSLLPIDISFTTAPGPPHFARVIHLIREMPSYEVYLDQKRRGQVVNFGSNCTGAYHPKWVLVW